MKRTTTLEEFFHPISGSVLPIYAFSGQQAYAAGTAVLIAPGIAVTAHHVLQGLLEFFNEGKTEENIDLDIYLTQFNTGATWYVCNTSTWVGTDISLLSLVPINSVAEEITVNPLQITIDPPDVKNTVIAYGYPKTIIEVPRNDTEQTDLKFTINPTLSKGLVTDVHASLRDSVNLRFPCFGVNAEYTAGMSGGAVFNENRELCGLVCAGGEGELANYSHATSIWPMSIIPVTIPPEIPHFEGVTSGEIYKMLELANLGYVNMRGHERIEFFTHENGSSGVRRKHAI